MTIKHKFRILTAALLTAGPLRASDSTVDYMAQIKPLLHERCYACHGALKQKMGLRVDTAASIHKGGDSGPAVEPGKSDESLLIELVTSKDEKERMPPEGEPLKAEEINLLRRWIDAGAPKPEHEEPEPDPKEHWAYQAPVRARVPEVRNAAWVRNPIDAFVAAEHERRGLMPVPPAEKHVLLRRVFVDLIGLPPTREQAQAFFSDASPDAFERVVDDLLASSDYAQRWARHWMDVWRYSDWSGENKNLVRGSPKHIWRWRDWIVDSLAKDKAYDRMIIEMLAGDEVAPGDPDALRATGFLARNWYEFNRNVWLDDTVEHTAKAFLGLTLGCAKCHDHKFDPVSQKEYYAWRAIFEPHDIRADAMPGQPDTEKDGLVHVFDAKAETPTYLFIRGEESRPDKARPLSPMVPAILGGQFEIRPVELPLDAWYPAMRPGASEDMIRRAESEVAAAERALAAAQSDDLKLAETKLAARRADLASLRERAAAEQAKLGKVASFDDLAVTAAVAEREAKLLNAELAILQGEQKLAAAQKSTAKGSKAALLKAEKELQTAKKSLATAEAAMKKTDASYSPLGSQYPKSSTGRRAALARWIANPANPLTARVAVNHVWQRHFGEPLAGAMDDFGRKIPRPELQPLLDWLAVEFMENGWSLKHLHRLIVTSNAYRMSSSTRDAAAANAELDRDNHFLWHMNSRRAEGEVIRDSILYLAGNLDRTAGGPEIPLDQADKSYRRSLYFRSAHERQVPFLKSFDGANVLECYRRSVTVVPQQALALANSAMPYEQSRQLATKLATEVPADADFVRVAFEQMLTRKPTAQELDRCLQFLEQPAEGSTLPPRASLIHALMNHNDFITIR